MARREHPPLMIDSMNAAALEKALDLAGSGCIINSASLADEVHLSKVDELAQRYLAEVVIAGRDQAGLATTKERKVDIAERTLARISSPAIVDLLALPVKTSPDAWKESVAAIGLISARTLLALSNFSFGLPQDERAAIEQDILHHAKTAGLDFVILNPR